MKQMIQTKARLLGGSLLGALLLASGTAHADVVTQTVDQTTGTVGDWNSAIWGTPADISRSTNAYIAPLAVRTSNTTTPAAFAGQTLTLDPTGVLFLKHTLGAANVKLILNGGQVKFHGGPSADNCPLSGTISVIADSVIGSDQGAPNNRNIWLQSSISGAANLSVLTINLADLVILSGTNTAYSGNWSCGIGNLQIASGAVNALGSGGVSLDTLLSSLFFNATNNFTITNVISGGGNVIKLNTNTVTLSGINTFSGTNEVRVGVLKLGAAAATDSASVIALTGGTLDASLIGGLVLNAGVAQSLGCRGTVVGNLTAATGTALNFNLTAATNDILNVTGSLTLSGNPTLNLNLAGFKKAGTYRLINYSGTILGGGTFTVVPPAGSVQGFSLDYSTAGQVNLVIVGDPKDLVWLGDGGGNAWDTASFNWTNRNGNVGLTNYSQGDYATFNDSGFSPVNVNEGVNPSSMTVSNTAVSYLFSGGVGISTDGTLTKAGTGDLVFENTGNNFTGPVDIQAGMLSVGSGLTTGSLGAPSAITNNGVFRVNLSPGSTAVTVNGPVSGSGAVEVTGGQAGLGGAILNLSASNSYAGLTTVGDECQLLFTNSSALGAAGTGTTVLANGRLGITAVVGAMTLAEPLTLNGGGITTGNNQGGALYVLGANNNITLTAPITIASSARVRVIDNNARMTFMNTVLGNNVGLRCSVGAQPTDAGALMTFSNTVSIGTGTLTKDGQGMVSFVTDNTVAGNTSIDEGYLLANGLFNGGPVAVNASGSLGGIGKILGAVTVGSAGTLAPGNNGIGTLTLSNTLTLNAAATTRMEINRTNVQNADLLVAAAIPMNGALTVVNTGPALQVGDTFNLFDGAISGAFNATNLPALALPNHLWDTSLLASQGIIAVATNTVPVLPLVITDIKRQTTTNVTMTWNSYPGKLYTVEYSLNLSNWATLKTGLTANGVTNTTTAVVDTTGLTSGLNNILAQYRMGGATAQIQNSSNRMAAGDLTAGPGLTLFNANANVTPAYANAPQLQVSPPNGATTLALAYAASSWFTFDLTVGTNLTDLDLTSLTFNGARGGGAAPRGYGIYVTTPTTTDELVRGATAFITQRAVWDPQTISLSGFSSLQNLTAGQVISFKVVLFCPAAANSAEFDDITVFGNISPRPITDYETAGTLFLRLKQQN